jgi:hypothetical protein
MLMSAAFGVAIPALIPIRYMYQGEAAATTATTIITTMGTS